MPKPVMNNNSTKILLSSSSRNHTVELHFDRRQLVMTAKKQETDDEKKTKAQAVVVYRYPRACRWKAVVATTFGRQSVRHINFVHFEGRTSHTDGSIDLIAEFVDGGSLERYLEICDQLLADKSLNEKERADLLHHRLQFCKSIVLQLLEAVYYLEFILANSSSTPHRNINPKTILIRASDGCVKLRSANFLQKEHIECNKHHFLENGYCDEKCRTSIDKRLQADFKNDVWAIGAIAYSIMTNTSLLPSWREKDSCHPSEFRRRRSPSSADNPVLLSQHAKKNKHFFEFVADDDDDDDGYDQEKNNKWSQLFPDEELCSLVRACLCSDPDKRPNSAQALAQIYASSSSAKMTSSERTDDDDNYDDSWSLDVTALRNNAFTAPLLDILMVNKKDTMASVSSSSPSSSSTDQDGRRHQIESLLLTQAQLFRQQRAAYVEAKDKDGRKRIEKTVADIAAVRESVALRNSALMLSSSMFCGRIDRAGMQKEKQQQRNNNDDDEDVSNSNHHGIDVEEEDDSKSVVLFNLVHQEEDGHQSKKRYSSASSSDSSFY